MRASISACVGCSLRDQRGLAFCALNRWLQVAFPVLAAVLCVTAACPRGVVFLRGLFGAAARDFLVVLWGRSAGFVS